MHMNFLGTATMQRLPLLRLCFLGPVEVLRDYITRGHPSRDRFTLGRWARAHGLLFFCFFPNTVLDTNVAHVLGGFDGSTNIESIASRSFLGRESAR